MSAVLESAVVVTASLLGALVLTPAARWLALRVGIVAHPMSERWHRQPTALLGGVAVGLATLVGVGVAALLLGHTPSVTTGSTVTGKALGVGVSAALMFLVGLLDDIISLRAQLKFVLQLLAGVTLLSFGGLLDVSPWYVANVVLTLFWFVALTNAFNLLDNMDGVAAGVGAIAAFFLGVAYARQQAWLHAALAWSLAGATLGFLRYNFHPARIFMGDAGSLFLGAALAGLAATSPTVVSGSLVSILFVPLTLVTIPILDTALVAITRTLAGRSIAEGGRDHTTHRLVALGLGERQVALLLYAFAALGGLVALFLTRLDAGLGILVGSVFLIAMCLLAAYLSRLHVYEPNGAGPPTRFTLLLGNLVYKRRLAEILLDVGLVALAYYGAYRLRFDGLLPPDYARAFEATLGLVIAVKVTVFALCGVYRSIWRYAGIVDLYRIVGAIVISTVAIFLYAEWRVPALAGSHSVLYIDALLTAALVLTARLSFRSLEELRKSLQVAGERVLIYGAGDGGELVLRGLLINQVLNMQPVCFLDDDPRKKGLRMHGLPVVGGHASLDWAVERYGVTKILLGTRKLSPETLAAVRALAARRGTELVQLDLDFHAVTAQQQSTTRETPAHPLTVSRVRGA